VILLDCGEEVSVKRLADRRIDPVTGKYYNSKTTPDDQLIKDRLEQHTEDKEEVVRKRWRVWDDFIGKIEEVYRPYLFSIKTELYSEEECTDIISEMMQIPRRD